MMAFALGETIFNHSYHACDFGLGDSLTTHACDSMNHEELSPHHARALRKRHV